MTSPSELAAALRAHAQGLYCGEAAAELLIAQSWLHSQKHGAFLCRTRLSLRSVTSDPAHDVRISPTEAR